MFFLYFLVNLLLLTVMEECPLKMSKNYNLFNYITITYVRITIYILVISVYFLISQLQ